MTHAALALAALAAISAALALAQPPGGPRYPAPPAPTRTQAPTSTPVPTPSPPRITRAQINRQDRASQHHRASEAEVFDARPLLTRLRLERAGVRIDIAGLAADDHHTVLAINPGRRSRTHARRVYQRTLRQAGDSGSAYVLEWAP